MCRDGQHGQGRAEGWEWIGKPRGKTLARSPRYARELKAPDVSFLKKRGGLRQGAQGAWGGEGENTRTSREPQVKRQHLLPAVARTPA